MDGDQQAGGVLAAGRAESEPTRQAAVDRGAQAHEDRLGPPLGTPLTPDGWLKALGGLPLSYPPGERFHYSHATEVLGFLVARIEGKTLGEVLEARIFAPLGMTDTAFWCPPA